jgi:hypothetical protein
MILKSGTRKKYLFSITGLMTETDPVYKSLFKKNQQTSRWTESKILDN